MILIPMADQNDFVVEAALEDMTYFLRFSWNSEAEIWVMSIENAENELIIQGVVLVPNVALLAPIRRLELPPGEFIAYCENPLEILDRNSFILGRVLLYYMSEEEYAAL